jgi:DnaK suppressor protein
LAVEADRRNPARLLHPVYKEKTSLCKKNDHAMDKTLIERSKSRLLEMRKRLIPTVQNVEQAILEEVRAPGDLSNAPTHLASEDEEGVDRSVAIAQNEEGLLEDVEAALARIENGAYGRCEDCAREIAKSRLEALPFTRYCIRCASQHEQVASGTP